MNLFSSDNHLLQLAKSGYRLPESLQKYSGALDKIYPVIALILAVIFIFVAQIGGGIAAFVVLIPFSLRRYGHLPTMESLLTPATGLESAILLIFTFGPVFLIVWAWIFLFEKRAPWTIGLEKRRALRNYLRGLLLGLAMFGAATGILAALGYVAFEQGDPRKQGLAALGSVLIIFAGWMVQGAAEEALVRGWLLPVIGSRYTALAGVGVSSLLFAALHLLNPGVSPIAVLNLFLFGVFASLFALREGGLWGVFGIHAAWNWAQGNLLGFEVSGNPVSGTLINLMEVGPDSITGGVFGPEGGLAVTAVLLIGSALTVLVNNEQ